MDSITQAALGAAVGEAVLGRKVGAKAAGWGAFFGTLPDLDVLVNPFVTEVQALLIHRGITHSVFFSLVVAPVAGLLLARLHRSGDAGWRGWALLVYLALLTHPLLDTLTIYGTQLLAPVSRYPFQVGSVFIIDPLYTGPLLVGVVVALFLRRASRPRRWVNGLGLGLSTLYLAWGLGAWSHASGVFGRAYADAGLTPERTLTAAAPFNTLLWMGLAVDGDSVYAGTYALLDDDAAVALQAIPRQSNLLEGLRGDLPVQRLFWFSRGFYRAEQRGEALLVHDLRFGRTDFWLTDDGASIFTFRLQFDADPSTAGPRRVVGFTQVPPDASRFGDGAFRRLWERALGQEDRVQASSL